MERSERSGPAWTPLDPPGNAEIPPGINLRVGPDSTTDPAAKNSSGSLPNSSGIYLGAAPLPPNPGFGIIPGHSRGASAASPGDSRRRSRIPEGEAEFPRGKRRSWHNSRQHSWQNSQLEQQGRDGSGSSVVQIPGYEPGLREGTIPCYRFN